MTAVPSCCECGQPMPAGEGAAARTGDAFRPETRKTVQDAIEEHKQELHDISKYIHANPELCYKEVKAHAKITSYLSSLGYTVEAFEQYPTAFKVSYTRGSGGRVFGLNSEYDALPDIGHACGHNLIAICGIGAFLGMRAAMDKHEIDGTVTLIGTPAEEGGVGKIKLYEIGAYDGIGACMMLHPGPGIEGIPTGGMVVRSSAIQGLNVEFFGKQSHAGFAPWGGVNALDAATTAYTSISALRQQLKPETRVQGIITNGGSAANVIPAHTAMEYLVRGTTAKEVHHTTERILKCFEGAAVSAGCTFKADVSHAMDELRNEPTLGTEWGHVMQEMFGAKIMFKFKETMGWSTDFGNITMKMPACHPAFSVPTPRGTFNHQPAFTASAASDEAFEESIKSTTAMACVGVRYLLDDDFAVKVRKGWEKEMEELAKE